MLSVNRRHNSGISFQQKKIITPLDAIELLTYRWSRKDGVDYFYKTIKTLRGTKMRFLSFDEVADTAKQWKEELPKRFPVLAQIRDATFEFCRGNDKSEEQIATFYGEQLPKLGTDVLEIE